VIKVAHLTTVDMSVRHLLLNQLIALRAAGFDVTAISAPGPDLAPVAAEGVRHLSVSFTRRLTPLTDLKVLWQLWRIFRRERFTIVHTHQAKAALLGQMAARLAGVPIVVNTLHGFYFHDGTPPLKRRLWIALERYQALYSDLILSQNPEDIETAVSERICSRNRIEFLGNGIDLQRFNRAAVSDEQRRTKRAELGFSDDTNVIGFVGRLVREKGFTELIQAFGRVRERVPGAKLLVIGPVDSEKTDAVNPDTAGGSGLREHIVFAGYRHDMPELFAAMDVCVLPSHREGFPRSPMEASAMGVPCVVTDIRGCRQVVEPGRNGIIVPVRQDGPLADAITKILQDGGLAKRMGAEGQNIARDQFDEQRVFERVVAAYRRLLDRKRIVADPIRISASLLES
jgi:glycosyltransferase involved in cell wall biosynthesis